MSSYFYSENSTGITIYEKINNPVTNYTQIDSILLIVNERRNYYG